MARSATSSVKMPGVLVTMTLRSRAAARSTESVPTPKMAITSSFGSAAISARSAPRLASVAIARMRPLSSAPSASGAGRWKRWVMAKRFASSAFGPSGNAPMLSTSIFMDASNFEDLLRGLVQARPRTVGLDEIIVADHGENRGRLVAGMDREVHVPLDRHGLIAAHQRPFHEVVALAVAIEPQLRRQSAAAHVLVVALGDLGAGRARLEQAQGVGLRLLHRFEAVDEFIRCLAQHDGARNLGIEAARPIVLDQEREVLPSLEPTCLQMAVDETRRLPERGRGAQEESLLAAEEPPLVLRQRGHVVVGHAGLNLLEHPRENLVLHLRGLANEILFLLALDRLEAIDEFGRIHEFGLAGELAFDARADFVRHDAAGGPSDGATATPLSFARDWP